MSFEGAEKRLEILFTVSSSYPYGLRTLTRSDLDELTHSAFCSIISHQSTKLYDGYVLSESSLFISPEKFILKTCGKTQILNSVHKLLKMTSGLKMKIIKIKYTRATFLFPDDQFHPYGNFNLEVEECRKHFRRLGLDERSYILGDGVQGLQWHVFYGCAHAFILSHHGGVSATHKSVEICIRGLDPVLSKQFVKTEAFTDARTVTIQSGIAELLPGAVLDDHVFDPCGYSMNGISDQGILTVHVTPEEDCSYGSIEFCCLKNTSVKNLSIHQMLQKVVKIFNPKELHLSVHSFSREYETLPESLSGYTGDGKCVQFLNDGSHIVFKAFHGQLLNVGGFVFESSSDTLSDVYLGDDSLSTTSSYGLLPSTCLLPSFLDKKHDIICVENIDLTTFTQNLISTESLRDTFYIVNLSVLHKLYLTWTDIFPRVEPFYAVKCNPDVVLLSLLGSLGCGFDCASKEELMTIKDLGIPSSRIIFANACKLPTHVSFAQDLGVSLTTFDTIGELKKLKENYPKCQPLVRIRADDPEARCHLGNKYGCQMGELPELFQAAKELGIDVIGVSFHVGSGSLNPKAYSQAIEQARSAFDAGLSMEFNMKILDIGGGFYSRHSSSQTSSSNSLTMHQTINEALDKYFPQDSGIRIIAEPGRFFAETCATLLCQVIGKRDRFNVKTQVSEKSYWITDGLYGSFNCIPYDHASPTAIPLPFYKENQNMYPEVYNSVVFGPTCDGLDTVLVDYPLSELDVGDWLLFPDMGAYTLAGASNFNGINAAEVTVFYTWGEFDN